MTEPDAVRLDQIYRHALELPAEKRMPYVLAQSGSNQILKRKLIVMLEAVSDQAKDPTLSIDLVKKSLFSAILCEEGNTTEDLSGKLVSVWRLDSPLARGGIATVYRAHRDDGQYSRQVAFKVLRRGLDTDDLINRFRAERQILSTLAHPGIADLLDGGAMDDGRPFLVMEFVDGLPIDVYCESNDLDTRSRVALIVEVLEAVHHAHMHLVVHRDIKPSNILVSHEGRVTLLDFGIAKLLDTHEFSQESVRTRTGVTLLTPRYGSPEQRAGQTVTTASDVYQVGAVLFELLARCRPGLSDASSGNASRNPPSQSASNARIAAELRGDLDAIVCKAMHHDSGQRYASANDMLADLNRYMERRPVLARPDSLWYRLGKLNRRMPWVLPVVVILVILLGIYIFTLNRYNKQIRTEQQRAIAATTFMSDLLVSADPYSPADPSRGKDITVVEALDFGLERLKAAYYGEDEILRASLLVSIADGFSNLDQHQKTIATRQEALVLERKLYGNISEPVIRSLRMLASQYRTIGKYATAGPLYLEQYEASKALYPPGHPEIGVAELDNGQYLYRVGRIDESIASIQSAVRILREAPTEYAGELINAIVWLSRVHPDSRGEEMLLKLETARQIADSNHGSREPLAGLVRTQTAQVLTQLGRFEEAEASFHQAISIYESDLGRRHGATLIALKGLGNMYFAKGDFARAEITHTEVLESYLEKYGVNHRGVASGYQNLGRDSEAQGRLNEALKYYRLSYASELAVLEPANPLAYKGLLLEAQARLRAGDVAQAAEDILVVLGTIEPLDNGLHIKQQAACLNETAKALLEDKPLAGKIACL